MGNQQSGPEIDDLAAEWAAKVDRSPLTAEQDRALRSWLGQDSRHYGAYAKARAVSKLTERARALGPNFQPAEYYTPAPASRRHWTLLWAASTAAAACLLAAVGLMLYFSGKHFNTKLGETLVVPLEDGTVITLNTASRLDVKYTRAERDVELLSGEALFDVAKDPERPFFVTAGGTRVRAIGTSFTVKRLPGEPVQVLVREGVIEVKASQQGASSVRAAANNRVTASENAALTARAVAPAEVTRELSWRDGRIAFEGQTLQEAADTFSRYSNTRIVILDSQVAAETITGLFVSNDAVGFAKAAALSLNLRVTIEANEVLLTR